MSKHKRYILLFSILLLMAGYNGYGQKTGGNSTSGGNSLGCNVYIPNAFTPNNDNINDRFEIGQTDNCKLIDYEMKIFDRWGRLVYESSSLNPQDAWDGTSEGKDVQNGVYMWNVNATAVPLNSASSEPENINRHGTVVVIR